MTELDEIDRRILHELKRDGRITNTNLAQRVGLSASACLRRVQELERNGTILGYRAIVDRASEGGDFTVYVAVGLSRHLKKDQLAFEQVVAAAPQVRECHNVSGAFEYLLRVEVADLTAFKHFHTDVLGTVSQVNSIVSYLVLGSSKDERA